uniref:Uncharacterized protein n=1 Tax=Mycena chlorophos TaxID=658473 RepID=A0ABQ0L6I4_MYCCL|nr:predicted protein [Mycena chlorophos]
MHVASVAHRTNRRRLEDGKLSSKPDKERQTHTWPFEVKKISWRHAVTSLLLTTTSWLGRLISSNPEAVDHNSLRCVLLYTSLQSISFL